MQSEARGKQPSQQQAPIDRQSSLTRPDSRADPEACSIAGTKQAELNSNFASQCTVESCKVTFASPVKIQLPLPDKPDIPASSLIGKPKNPNWLGFYAGDRSSFISQSDACDSRQSLMPSSQREFQKEFMMIEEFNNRFSIPNITSDPRSHLSPSKDTKRDWPGPNKQPASIYFSEDCSTPAFNAEIRTIREEQNESSERFNRLNSQLSDFDQRRKDRTDFEEWTKELARSEQMLRDLGSISADNPQNPQLLDKERASHLAAHSSHASNASGQSQVCFTEKNSSHRTTELQTKKKHQAKNSWTGTGVQITPLIVQKPTLLLGTNPNFSPILEIPEAPTSSRDRIYRMVELSREALLATSPCNQQQPKELLQKQGEKRQSEQIEIDNCEETSENSNDHKLVKRIDMCDVQLVASGDQDDQKSDPQRKLRSFQPDELDVEKL